ncbi:MAG: cytochrome ubiquinol oxidase subunit I [Candidatus Sumerlaeota bacterium]|nr:cytochrome ubiquinol oxidase subunit I [Candidatus Sumerlaeota bacterium]
MHLDAVFLSRLQFAVTVMFHYLFPPATIGLGVLLVIMEALYLKTNKPVYESMAKFWTGIFGLNFAMGVATGIVMEFQFGLNWATYSRFVGDVFGSALAAEGIFAFFLESGFLAIMVFGWNRVGPKLHFFSTLMVALGSFFSAIWIVVANSWQQTPAGYHLVAHGAMTRAEVASFWAVVFNPSSVARLLHVTLGAWILGAFFVMSVTAYYILHGRHLEFARKAFTIALVVGALSSLAQLAAGDWSGRIAAQHQPAKLAAMEGVFETRESTPMHLIGWPDQKAHRMRYGIAIPGLLSFLVYHDFKTPVTGLDKIPDNEEPPVPLPFFSFRIMVGLGAYFIAATLAGLFFLWRGTLFEKRWLMWAFVLSVVLPYFANEFGWVATEVGRQPWAVQGLLRTADGVSTTVGAPSVLASLLLFVFVYALLFALFLMILDRKIGRGPEPYGEPEPETVGGRGLLDAISRRGKRQYDMVSGK